MASKPHIKGKNAKLTFQLAQANAESKNLIIEAKSFELEPDVTEIADGILGKNRDELDSETNYYKVSLQCLTRDVKLLEAFIDHQAEKDKRVAMAASGLGLLIQPHDATQKGFSLVGFTLGAWKYVFGGRVERAVMTIPGRCEDLAKLPSL